MLKYSNAILSVLYQSIWSHLCLSVSYSFLWWYWPMFCRWTSPRDIDLLIDLTPILAPKPLDLTWAISCLCPVDFSIFCSLESWLSELFPSCSRWALHWTSSSLFFHVPQLTVSSLSPPTHFQMDCPSPMTPKILERATAKVSNHLQNPTPVQGRYNIHQNKN